MLKNWINKRAYARAQAKASDNQTVCAVVSAKGKPVYFVADRDAPDWEVEREAFRIRHGRDLSKTEQTLSAIARNRGQ